MPSPNTFTPLEKALKFLSGIITVPLTPFGIGPFSVRANTVTVIQRFGKIDRIVGPGLHWAPTGVVSHSIFTGAQTHKFENLRLVDSAGTPIVVTAAMQYNISDPAAVVTVANRKTDVLMRECTALLRKICLEAPYRSADGSPSLSTNKVLLQNNIKDSLNKTIKPYGFKVESLDLVEVNYAPDVAQQMLMKQQATAYMEARKEIVAGAVGVAKETIASLPDLSKETQERIVTNLLTTLTSGGTPQPVVQLR